MKKIILFTFVLLTISSLALFADGKGEDFEVPAMEGYESVTADGLAINVQWMITGENLNVQVTAATTGWIAVGFDPSSKMKDANILIGYVSDGNAFLRDDFGIGAVKHGPDTENGGTENFSELSGSEKDGVTQLQFTIPLDSGDPLDKPLTPGSSYKIIVAHGPDDTDDFGTYHASRGSINVEL